MTSTALLIMDVQQRVVERVAGDEGYLTRLATAITAARSAGIGVIYVTGVFRPGISGDQRAQQGFRGCRRNRPVHRRRPHASIPPSLPRPAT